MSKAIEDIFGEFEIDEDYLIKTKDVIGLFVAQKEVEKKEEEPAPPPAPVVEEAPPVEEDEGDARRRRRKRRRLPSKSPKHNCRVKERRPTLSGTTKTMFNFHDLSNKCDCKKSTTARKLARISRINMFPVEKK